MNHLVFPVLAASACWLAVPLRAQVSPDAPCSAEKSNPLTTRVDFAAVVTPPYDAKLLRVWLPLPPSDEVQEVSGSEFETWPLQVEPRIETEPVHGNRFAYFEFTKPKGAQMVRHRFTAKTHELRWRIDPARVESIAEWPAAFAPYLRSEEQAVVLTDAVRAVADKVAATAGSDKADVFAAMRWVDANMRYDHGRCSLAASSTFALANSCGHCSDYHGLTAALGRALHHPSRVTYGINLFAKQSPSHCKAEVFLPPYGWVSFDVSETQRQIKAVENDAKLEAAVQEKLVRAARQRTEQGYRDNTWLLLTRGTDYELAPKAAARAAVVRTIYAEADGVALRDPDPSDPSKREFAWMTMHSFAADRAAPYPYKGIEPLQAESEGKR